jgi:hypothetical protein
VGSKHDFRKILLAVAEDIAGLKDDFPQLRDFSPPEHAQPEGLQISYGFHTRQPRHRGGWTSGVPNPDDDGIWFHIDFHDKDSMAQIHTQPVVPKASLREKVVMLLILEGAATKPLAGRIWEILQKNGATRS